MQTVYQVKDLYFFKMQQYHKCICCSPVMWNIRIKVSGYHIADIQVSKADCNLKHIYIKQQIWSFLIYRKAFIRKKNEFLLNWMKCKFNFQNIAWGNGLTFSWNQSD